MKSKLPDAGAADSFMKIIITNHVEKFNRFAKIIFDENTEIWEGQSGAFGDFETILS